MKMIENEKILDFEVDAFSSTHINGSSTLFNATCGDKRISLKNKKTVLYTFHSKMCSNRSSNVYSKLTFESISSNHKEM